MAKSDLPRLFPAILRFILAALLTVAVGAALYLRQTDSDTYTTQTVPPTCTASGYTVYMNTRTGASRILDAVPAAGHVPGEAKTIRHGDQVQPTILSQICTVCGEEERQAVYPVSTLPRLSLYGSVEGIGKSQEVSLRVDFAGESQSFSGYAALKYQGHESLQYPKKNYTVKFYLDEDHDLKNKRTFSHWNPEHKYILKANFEDPSHCRNIVCADIWAGMVQARKNVPGQLSRLSNYGAVDGFPAAVYLNDEFHGLYTLTLHKDDDLFGMEDGREQAIMIANSASSPEAYFRAEAVFGPYSPWEIEFCGTEDTAWAKKRLNELIDFVMNSDGETFRKELKTHLDVDSAVDYLIALYALGLSDHAASDLILVCYGKNEPWICSLFDMQDAFGLESSEEFLPRKQGEKWDSCTESLLWDRILNTFYEEICRRYTQLRSDVLDAEKIVLAMEAYTAQIPKAVFQTEAEVNGTAAFSDRQLQEMGVFIRNQLTQLDKLFSE